MDDLYEDLENYDDVNVIEELKNENRELKSQVEKYSTAIAQLQKDFDKLTSEYKKLEKNYSSLLKTARAEIERKADIIKTLNTEKDMLVIKSLQRRGGNILKPQRSNSNDRQSKNNGRSSNQDADKLKQNSESTDNSHKNNRLDSVMSSVDAVSTTSNENKSTSSDSKDLKDIRNNENAMKSRDKTNRSNRKENMEQKVVSKKIMSRRKSMPATSFQISKFSSDEEEELCRESIRKSPVRHDYRDSRIDSHNYHESRDSYRRNHSYGDSGHRYGDRYEQQKLQRHYSPEQNYRYANDSSHHNYRHRLRKSPPSNKYNRSKSRDRRYMDNHRDNDRYYHQYESYSHKSKVRSEFDEPSGKRQKLESYKKCSSKDNYMSDKEKEMYERLHDIQEDSCQSPDYIHDTYVPQHIVKEIKYTSSTSQEDPRISSKKYILQTCKDKECLFTTASRSIEIKCIDKSVWGIAKVEMPEALRKRPSDKRKESESNELINRVYMDYENTELESLEFGEIEIEDDAVISNLTKKNYEKGKSENYFENNTMRHVANESELDAASSISNINNLNESKSTYVENIKIKNQSGNDGNHVKTEQKNTNDSDNINKPKMYKVADVTENLIVVSDVNNEKLEESLGNCDSKIKICVTDTVVQDSKFSNKNIEKRNENRKCNKRNSKVKSRKVPETTEKYSDWIMKNTDKLDEKKNKLVSCNKTKIQHTSDASEHNFESSDDNNQKTKEKDKKQKTSDHINDKMKHEADLLKINVEKGDDSNKMSKNPPETVLDPKESQKSHIKYKIPKAKKPNQNNESLKKDSDEKPKAVESTNIDSNMNSESSLDLKLKCKIRPQNIKDHNTIEMQPENKGNELEMSNRSKPSYDKSIQEILATVKGDLELSDEDDIIDFQKQIVNEGTGEQSNAFVATDVEKTSRNLKEIKTDLPTCDTNNLKDTKEFLNIKKSSTKESTRESKKRKGKRKISVSYLVAEVPKIKQTKSIGNKQSEQVDSQEKINKFSDLFGDSNSLITPDDLGIPVSNNKIKSNVKFLSIFDNTEDAVDLNVEDITKRQNTEFVNFEAQNELASDKIVSKTGTVDKISNNENKNNHEPNFQMYENIVAETSMDSPNVVKTVIISTGGVIDRPSDITGAPNVNNKIEAMKCVNGLGALATSTPYKNIENNTVLHNNDASSNNVKEVNCSLNSTQSTELHNSNPVETDAPDVRIFVRRRRKIIKKPT